LALLLMLGLTYPGMAAAKKVAPTPPAAKSLKIVIYADGSLIAQRLLDEALRRGLIVTLVTTRPQAVAKANKRLTVVEGGIGDLGDTARKMARQQAVFVLVDGNDAHIFPKSAKTLVMASRIVGVFAPRIIWIGDAAALKDSHGDLVLMSRPQSERDGRVLGQIQALRYLKTVDDAPWSYLTPPLTVKPGKRTTTFRTGADMVLLDKAGKSEISAEDFAVAAINEAEKFEHPYAQFTVAY
jgi:putative NADH-flavin reductase